MDVVDRWDALMAEDPARARVAEAAALVDAARTGHDPDALLARVDSLAAGCPHRDEAALHRRLFADLGLHGDADDYHHERNSLLSRVLDRRRGLPILLSVIVADVAATVGIGAEVVGMPGHVLIHLPGPAEGRYLDAFAGGSLLDVAGCAALFRRIHGQATAFDERMLSPIGLHEVAARILANLKNTYMAAGDVANLRWVTDLRRRVPGVGPADALDHAAVLGRIGLWEQAAELLDDVAASTAGPISAQATQRALALRARAN